MKNYITNLENLIDKAWLEKHIRALYRLEKLQTFPAYQASADYVYKLLKDEGLEAEIVHCPADGKTVYQDVRMPLGWNVENMTLTLLTPIDGIKDGVLADYRKNRGFDAGRIKSGECIRRRIYLYRKLSAGNYPTGGYYGTLLSLCFSAIHNIRPALSRITMYTLLPAVYHLAPKHR